MTEWILCDEQLPKAPIQVLVTVRFKKPEVNYEVTLGEYWGTEHGWGEWANQGKVIAWMPLPQPLKL